LHSTGADCVQIPGVSYWRPASLHYGAAVAGKVQLLPLMLCREIYEPMQKCEESREAGAFEVAF